MKRFRLIAGLVAVTALCSGASTTVNVAVNSSDNSPRPIRKNYLYIGDGSKAIKYLNGGSISGTSANLTGVAGIATSVQQTFVPISGSLSGKGANQTMTIGIPFFLTLPVGEHVTFTSMSPANWNESCVVTASTQGTVTCINPNASGTFVPNRGLFSWNNTSIPIMLHSHGMASIDFIGGGCFSGKCNGQLAYKASVGVDDIIVDEPASGDTGWPATMSYWQSVRPGGGFGFTTGDETCAQIKGYLAAPYSLPLSYGEMEFYVGGGTGNACGTPPPIPTIALLYGTTALCSNSGGAWLSQFQTVAFWDVDNYAPLANPNYMDYNWLQNAQIYIETGSPTSICTAASFLSRASPNSNHQTGSFTVTTADNMMNSSPYSIKSCQYSVYSGANLVYGLDDQSAVQTVPWTAKPCNGATGTITVGPTGNCNVNSIPDVGQPGHETYVCAVAYRAIMNSGGHGDETYTLFTIN
jgi:hypothetical protein